MPAPDRMTVWEDEKQYVLAMMPYESTAALEQALRSSPVFGAPRVSGAWRWYPVLPDGHAGKEYAGAKP